MCPSPSLDFPVSLAFLSPGLALQEGGEPGCTPPLPALSAAAGASVRGLWQARQAQEELRALALRGGAWIPGHRSNMLFSKHSLHPRPLPWKRCRLRVTRDIRLSLPQAHGQAGQRETHSQVAVPAPGGAESPPVGQCSRPRPRRKAPLAPPRAPCPSAKRRPPPRQRRPGGKGTGGGRARGRCWGGLAAISAPRPHRRAPGGPAGSGEGPWNDSACVVSCLPRRHGICCPGQGVTCPVSSLRPPPWPCGGCPGPGERGSGAAGRPLCAARTHSDWWRVWACWGTGHDRSPRDWVLPTHTAPGRAREP